MTPLTSAILITWRRNASYAQRLVDGLPSDVMIAQPPGIAAALNHPAWIFSHLNLYADLAVRLAAGEHLDDPADHPHGQRSSPLADAANYQPRDTLLATWSSLHAAGDAALQRVTTDWLAAPTPLERWRAVHPTVGDMLVTLMVKHESHHLGQFSAWRRAMGLPRVAM